MVPHSKRQSMGSTSNHSSSGGGSNRTLIISDQWTRDYQGWSDLKAASQRGIGFIGSEANHQGFQTQCWSDFRCDSKYSSNYDPRRGGLRLNWWGRLLRDQQANSAGTASGALLANQRNQPSFARLKTGNIRIRSGGSSRSLPASVTRHRL